MPDQPFLPNLYIGPAGWSYPDWKGRVYNRTESDPLRFMLPYFNCIELNTTFYQPPSPTHVESWVNKAALLQPTFQFTYKLWKELSHGDSWGDEQVIQYKKSVQPLLEGGHRTMLCQLPFYFDATPARISRLERLAEAFHEYDLMLEVRHASFDQPDIFKRLNQAGYAICWLDYPTSSTSFINQSVVFQNTVYIRLHGRNTKNWFSKTATVASKYDYLYDTSELETLVQKIRQEMRAKRKVYVITNNHYQGKAVANALELHALLAESTLSIPPLLLEHYPHLQAYHNEPPEQPDLF
jgi:uncharacterized protein YecE (DUF72 family)